MKTVTVTADVEVFDGEIHVTLGDGTKWTKPIPKGMSAEDAVSEYMELIVKQYGSRLVNIEVEKKG